MTRPIHLELFTDFFNKIDPFRTSARVSTNDLGSLSVSMGALAPALSISPVPFELLGWSLLE
jgi:hypothetical protein